jgi:hypothetical protein
MDDLTKYLLNNEAELEALRTKIGEVKFAQLQESVRYLLDAMPKNRWIDYRQRIHPDNCEAFIKIVCHYINTHRSITDFVEFNNTCTNIRRKVEPPPEPKFEPWKHSPYKNSHHEPL